VRRLLFRCPGDIIGRFPNRFSHKPDAPAHVRDLIVGSYASTGSYGIAPLSTRSSSNSSMACSESSSVEVEDAAVVPPVDAQVVFAAAVEGGKGMGAAELKVQLSMEASRVVVAAH
jgi:hypothetical protein